VRSVVADPSPYLSTRQVCARFGGVTRQWLWLAVRHHGFPKPLKRNGGSRCFYPLAQIIEWEATAFRAASDNSKFPVPAHDVQGQPEIATPSIHGEAGHSPGERLR
jgi:predicted DNA-binding transcriptional regulator AlpA